jgi:hypothetical protein
MSARVTYLRTAIAPSVIATDRITIRCADYYTDDELRESACRLMAWGDQLDYLDSERILRSLPRKPRPAPVFAEIPARTQRPDLTRAILWAAIIASGIWMGWLLIAATPVLFREWGWL